MNSGTDAGPVVTVHMISAQEVITSKTISVIFAFHNNNFSEIKLTVILNILKDNLKTSCKLITLFNMCDKCETTIVLVNHITPYYPSYREQWKPMQLFFNEDNYFLFQISMLIS